LAGDLRLKGNSEYSGMSQSDKPVPEAVDRFLARYVQSIEYLEILLLLADQPDRRFTADEIAQAIYSVSGSATRRLDRMVADRLVESFDESPRSYRFAPEDARLNGLVSQVAETYRERRVAVITLIASRPMDNVRAFSDAFRLGKKDKP
jgi:hypothetical protein